MPRIRSIKPEFWTDDKILELSIPARLFFIGLWNFADDNGVLENKPRQLKARIFPADDIQVEELIEELHQTGLVLLYAVNGDKYLQIKNFRKHQVIDKPRKTVLPLPPPEISAEFSGNQLISTEINPGKGKGKGSGKGSREDSPVIVPHPRKPKGEAVGGGGMGEGEPHPQSSPEANKPAKIFASPMPGGMDGDACTSFALGFEGDDEPDLSVCHNPESPCPGQDEARPHKDSGIPTAIARKQRGTAAGGNGDARSKPRKVFGCEAFTITEDLHEELCRCFPLLPPEQILAEYEKIRDWCLDNRLTPRHRKKFTGAGQLREPRRFLKNWFRKEEPNPAYLRPLPSVREPPPEPEDILVPDPKCPVCRGGGLARDGPCQCLRLEREVLAMRGRDGQNPSESGTTAKPSGGSGSRAVGPGSNPSQAEQPV